MLKYIGNMKVKNKFKRKLTVWQMLVLGYLAVIFAGAAMLCIPFATAEGQSTTFLNALFTATSATCVTGLVPYDTAIHWSAFGQIVILILIQTGGLGFMTIVSMLFVAMRRGLNMYERTALIQSTGQSKFYGIKRLLMRILIGTLIFETFGLIMLSIRFIPEFGAGKGLYFALWHSVSAYCNAGFDLMGANYGAFSSLTHFAGDPIVSLTIDFLIIVGGLGFCVWSDIIDCKFNFKKFQLYTKVSLIMSAALIVVPTAFFALFERNNQTLEAFSGGEKFLIYLFMAISPRTAGFSVVDLSQISNSGYLLTCILMLIGGSSGSTAGGIKVTTVAVIFMGMIAVFRGKRDINIGKKRIKHALVSQALAIFMAYAFFVLVASLTITSIEPDTSFSAIVFECLSALGTVGLSINLTPNLSTASKIVLIFLMYLGRVGVLTLAYALTKSRKTGEVRKPVDTLPLG